MVKEVSDEEDQVLILLGDFVQVPEINTEFQAPILLLGKENGGTSGLLGQSDESLPKHVVNEFSEETELYAREQVDVAVRRGLVVLKVNLMIKLTTRRHVLSLFS